MQPQIKTAEHQLSFSLNDDYIASLYTEVESMGFMQYLHFLVIHGPDKVPAFFICAEWFDAESLQELGPVLGAFYAESHVNYGSDKKWSDVDLFVLKSIEIAQKTLSIDSDALVEGEAWALTNILKKIQESDALGNPNNLTSAYWNAMSKNDSRVLEYLRSSKSLLSRGGV